MAILPARIFIEKLRQQRPLLTYLCQQYVNFIIEMIGDRRSYNKNYNKEYYDIFSITTFFSSRQ